MLTERKIARYGWVRDHPDPNDRLYALEQHVYRASQLPRTVDLRPQMPPVVNQENLGSCTANGITACLAYEALRQGETLTTAPGYMSDNTAGNAGYSRLFVYYNERKIEGTVNYDSGAQIRDGIKTVAAQGAPYESTWPYDVSRFTERPPAVAYNAALGHKAIQYQRITPDGPGAPVHTALANGLPVVFGFSVPSSFEDGSWDPASQPLPLPGPGDQFIGGHCTVLVGYDLNAKTFVVRNSWGVDWGQDGYFEMVEEWVDPYRGLASDFWVLSRVS